MTNNEAFRPVLLVDYLYLLMSKGYKDTFDFYFEELKGFLQKGFTSSDNMVLEKLKAVLAYKKNENIIEK